MENAISMTIIYIYIFSSSRENSQAQKDVFSAATSSVEVAIVTDVKCRVCGVPADARFDPCGHVIACVDCATMLKKCFLCKVKGFHLMPYKVLYLQIRKLLVMKRRPTFPLLLRWLARSLKDSLLQLTIFETPWYTLFFHQISIKYSFQMLLRICSPP